ncbi:hypothetical protein [Marinisporobacter balticus]|uniref:Uncharacterized protein n=1 Tax=Marinisporobacter balticus TaxID=2018667 RepID=A0A4R2KUF2_9FIRM|nr:hypothetical protein [Marinisporobacter balticus]TCO76512.1 hypothetical protein EV214_108115 [Marinisporobacter balticus]
MRFRKKDYIIFYILTIIIYGMNLMNPVKVRSVFAIAIVAIFPRIIMGNNN